MHTTRTKCTRQDCGTGTHNTAISMREDTAPPRPPSRSPTEIQDVPSKFLCPISLQRMTDPVVVSSGRPSVYTTCSNPLVFSCASSCYLQA